MAPSIQYAPVVDGVACGFDPADPSTGNGYHALLPGNGPLRIDAYERQWKVFLTSSYPCLCPERVDQVLIASREAVLNAIEHGCAGRSGASVIFRMVNEWGEGRLAVWVFDPGPGVSLSRFDAGLCADPFRDRGRGLLFIRAWAAEIRCHRNPFGIGMVFGVG